MSNILTPAEQAAANLAKRAKSERKQQLLQICLAAIANYDGTSCVSIQIDLKLADVIEDVQSEMKGWSLYLSHSKNGKLSLGTPEQVQSVKLEDLIESGPPVTIMPIPSDDGKPAHEQSVSVHATASATTSDETERVKRTFKVHSVDAETKPLSTTDGATVFQQLLKTPVEACGVGATLVKPYGFHALVEATHKAFGQHYGLELAPDHIWHTIVQGFAKVVNMEPETYRARFVSHQGQELIKIRRDEFVMTSLTNDWAGCLDEFSAEIRKRIGDARHDLLVSDFSTTGDLERVASNVALMDTVQSYFRYSVDTMCGIPFVTLHGSAADWAKVATKTRLLLSEFKELSWWLTDVIAVTEKIAAAAEGTIDLDFWNSIYKSKSTSGGIDITGWLLKLIPYITYYNGKSERNPMLGQRNCKPHSVSGGRRSFYDNEADLEGDETISTGMLPQALSTVPFIWDYYGKDYDYQFVAGIVGYSQNAKDGALRPEMGWAVRPAPAAKS